MVNDSRKRVVVAHHLFHSRGGESRLCAVVVDELLRRGHETAIATTSQFDAINTFNNDFGIRLTSEPRQFYVFRGSSQRFGIFHRLTSYLAIRKAIRRFKPDCVFVDLESIRPLEKDVKTHNTRIVRYVHFPTVAETSIRGLLREKYFRFPYNLYWKLFLLFHQKLVPKGEEDFSHVICANSEFTKHYVERIWKRKDVKVVYPPVAVSQYTPESKKRDMAVCLGRFTPEKRVEVAIQAVSECETDFILNLIGGLIPSQQSYFHRLKKLCKRLRVEDRVRFYPNAPFEILRKILGMSKAFIHPIQNEHFGISTVEAMASGCIPICHNSGGSVEILGGGRYGRLFDDHSQISQHIDGVMGEGDEMFRRRSASAVERARRYDEVNFRENILALMT